MPVDPDPSASRAVRSMAGGALAPIQTSTGSAGRSARLASTIRNRREELTVSPASRRRTMSSASSKTEGRVLMLAPIAANLTPAQPAWRRALRARSGIACSIFVAYLPPDQSTRSSRFTPDPDVSAEERWDADPWLLRAVPAHVRFVSFEPLLGPVDPVNLDGIHWAIVGGESGPGARAIDCEWVEAIQAACRDQRVAFFFKQWGGTRKGKTGRLLDGRTWDEYPAFGKLDRIGSDG
jgi:hypothetical protein